MTLVAGLTGCDSDGSRTSSSNATESTLRPATTISVASTITNASPSTTEIGSEVGVTTLSLREGALTLRAGRDVFDLTGFDPYHVAMSPTGSIVVSMAESDRRSLFALADGNQPIDTGIRLTVDSSFAFGPHGDLFTVERPTTGPYRASQYHVEPNGPWTLVTTVDAPTTGECGITVSPIRAGCPSGTGPAVTFDPPVPFNHVEGDPLLAGTQGTGIVRRSGGGIERQWIARLDVPLGIDCTDNSCAYLFVPGPAGSSVYVPFVGDSGNRRAAFILDDRNDAGAAILDGDIPVALGMRGSELLCVQTGTDHTSIVAIDLTPIQQST